jgi:hypothetical protein
VVRGSDSAPGCRFSGQGQDALPATGARPVRRKSLSPSARLGANSASQGRSPRLKGCPRCSTGGSGGGAQPDGDVGAEGGREPLHRADCERVARREPAPRQARVVASAHEQFKDDSPLDRTGANVSEQPIVATRFAKTRGSDRLRDAHEPPNVATERSVVVSTANVICRFAGLWMGGTGLEPVTPSLSSWGRRRLRFGVVRSDLVVEGNRLAATNVTER